MAGNHLLCWVRVDANIIDTRYARALLQVAATDLRVRAPFEVINQPQTDLAHVAVLKRMPTEQIIDAAARSIAELYEALRRLPERPIRLIIVLFYRSRSIR